MYELTDVVKTYGQVRAVDGVDLRVDEGEFLVVAGGLIAGAAGGLRAARLRPADALRSIG